MLVKITPLKSPFKTVYVSAQKLSLLSAAQIDFSLKQAVNKTLFCLPEMHVVWTGDIAIITREHFPLRAGERATRLIIHAN